MQAILFSVISVLPFLSTISCAPTEDAVENVESASVEISSATIPLVNGSGENATDTTPVPSVTIYLNGTAVFSNGTVYDESIIDNDNHRKPKLLALFKLLAAELLRLDGLAAAGWGNPDSPLLGFGGPGFGGPGFGGPGFGGPGFGGPFGPPNPWG